ncbi:acyl-ACP--UDP-N-acetylglucosamine O-acyltransferase [Pleurocapsa sp. FMAR1]|uniref:acyl-ACP--UDP-N-acetylglucosamine O-acyltransferase n=1 Tax=Pleurocapsa sp. FMAR1 TaxID=3040204 RepID=UPI0029C6A03F|nr:acyl-ACP--UDP-N-acetylglucosamine O-acyltransferase [Pleurocapsa sp. FMAR1]
MRTLIHPTAVIDDHAQIHPTVRIEPYAVIGSQVTIGADTVVGSHVIIDGLTTIGKENQIFPGAAIGLEPQDLKYKGANSQVIIGDRNRIREYVTINRATNEGEATVIGDDNLLMAYAHVGHNCVIGNEVVIANSVAIAGHVHIESMAIISGVLGIHQFVHIGTMAMVGGMSRISRDVPPYMMVEGNPARVRSLNLTGLKRRGFDQNEVRELKKAFRILYLQQIPLTDAIAQLDQLSDNKHIRHLQDFVRQSSSGRRGLIMSKK